MDAQGTWNFQPLVLTLNSMCTFALNLSVFLVIQHTSALTIRVAGVVKDWVVVLLSAILFADTKLTLINIFGYAIGNILHLLLVLFPFPFCSLQLTWQCTQFERSKDYEKKRIMKYLVFKFVIIFFLQTLVFTRGANEPSPSPSSSSFNL
ncbi:hypothetical protein HanHA300_Chr11g0389291 [Helianthus annuus]|nr:hypothetical protein HanHA300_Chr11g0389291 [Helianthus annuus]KAJ0688241.1 hypothetical protein HanOQP8_Chr11g0392161 [Helianthus annuus]